MKLRQDGSRTPWSHLLRDIIVVVRKASYSIAFIEEYRLWKGLNSYKWLSKALLMIGVLLGLYLVTTLIGSFDIFGNQPKQQGIAQAVTGAFSGVFGDVKDLFMNGAMKYVILVLIEVVIFHFVRMTLIVTTKTDIDTSFKTFMKAQKRMIKVVIVAWVMEVMWSMIVRVPFWLFSNDLLEDIMLFLVQAFFTGFVIVDNYNEVYHMTIKQSSKYAWQYAGITLTVGAMVMLILYVPLVGTISGPLLGAVVAALALDAVHNVDRNMNWVFERKRILKKRR